MNRLRDKVALAGLVCAVAALIMLAAYLGLLPG